MKPKYYHIYELLHRYYGPQHWWPGETQMEVILGAILTQNTSWTNVEKAIHNLKQYNCLDAKSLKKISRDHLATLIKPAGYFNIKAKRIKNFITYIFDAYDGNVKQMERVSTSRLREELLRVNGIGPETADSILLYAFARPVFVIDAYTKRIWLRHYLVAEDVDYYGLQDEFIQHLEKDEKLFNEYHALIVRVAKDFCRTKPDCKNCPLNVLFD